MRAAAARAVQAMSARDKYLFDLQGFVVVRNVLSAEEVQAANRAIDAHMNEAHERTEKVLRNTPGDRKAGAWMAGTGPGRIDLAGMLGWPSPQRDIFRSILAHPKLVPYFRELLGDGYREFSKTCMVLEY